MPGFGKSGYKFLDSLACLGVAGNPSISSKLEMYCILQKNSNPY